MSRRKPRTRPKPKLAPDGLPEPLRWYPVLRFSSLLVGALLCVGGRILLQQLGAEPLTTMDLVGALVLGLLLGIAVPSLGRLVGVLWANRNLRKARQEMQAQAPQRRPSA